MKILHVLDCSVPNVSGYASRSNYIVEFQKKIGFDPIVVTSPRQENVKSDQETLNGILYYRIVNNSNKFNILLQCLPYFKEKLQMEIFKKRILEIVYIERPNIIHAHSPVLWGLVASSVARKCKVPLVYEVRALWEDAAVDQGKAKVGDLRYRITRFLETRLFRQAKGIITICEGLKNEIIDRGIERNKIFVIPNGVNTDKFIQKDKNLGLIDKLNLKNKIVLGFIGSFYKFEGLDVLINAMPKILEKNTEVMLLIVGGGNEEVHLRKQVHQLSLNGKVIFTGKITHEDIIDYYSIIDILVYPRIRVRITEMVTPIKPLEAMSMGKTILASDVGGLKELIKNNKTGMLFKADDSVDLANKSLILINDLELRKKLGQEARLDVKEQRSWHNIISNYQKIYPVILERT